MFLKKIIHQSCSSQRGEKETCQSFTLFPKGYIVISCCTSGLVLPSLRWFFVYLQMGVVNIPRSEDGRNISYSSSGKWFGGPFLVQASCTEFALHWRGYLWEQWVLRGSLTWQECLNPRLGHDLLRGVLESRSGWAVLPADFMLQRLLPWWAWLPFTTTVSCKGLKFLGVRENHKKTYTSGPRGNPVKLSKEKCRELRLGGNKHRLGDGCLNKTTTGKDLRVILVGKLNVSQQWRAMTESQAIKSFRLEKTLSIIKSSHKYNTAKSSTKPCPWLEKSTDRMSREVHLSQQKIGYIWSPMPSFGSCSHGRKAFLFRMTVIKRARRLKN